MKKLGSLLMCVILLLSMAVTVHATDITPEESGVSAVTEQEGLSDPESQEDQTSAHVHSWGEGVVTTAATCTEPGVRTYTCSCTETKTEEISAPGHSFGSWQITQEKHSRTCGACGASEEGSHSYGAWQDQGAGHSRTCTTCGNAETGSHAWSSTVQKKPTCKEEGIMEYLCSVCNGKKQDKIEKLSVHTYDSACDSECNVCAARRVVEHDFEEVWVKDSTGHWYACTKCDEKIAFAKHNPGPEATEDSAQVCTTCKYVIAPKKQHSHSFEKKWTNDEAGHWHACKTCEAEQEYAAHVYTDACDSKCDICGFEKDTGHTYDEQWKTTKWEHWNVCTVCGEESRHEKHVPGEEATEASAQLCTVCGYELEPAQIHAHDFSENWEWDTVNHWQVCSCGEESVAMEHTWDEGREIRKDVLEFSCTQCGMTKMEKKDSGFPWMILLVILALACIGGIVYLVILLKRGQFDEDDGCTEEEDPAEPISGPVNEDLPETEDAQPDAEEEMIDAFFASLDKD